MTVTKCRHSVGRAYQRKRVTRFALGVRIATRRCTIARLKNALFKDKLGSLYDPEVCLLYQKHNTSCVSVEKIRYFEILPRESPRLGQKCPY